LTASTADERPATTPPQPSVPNALMIQACACRQWSKASSRARTPSLVRIRVFTPRLPAASEATRPLFSNGRKLRISVVRSISRVSANCVYRCGPCLESTERTVNCPGARPTGFKAPSKYCVTTPDVLRRLAQVHKVTSMSSTDGVDVCFLFTSMYIHITNNNIIIRERLFPARRSCASVMSVPQFPANAFTYTSTHTQFSKSMLATSLWRCHEGLFVKPHLDVSC
jgi:hypothetical protein